MEFVMAKTEHANLDIRVFDKSNPNGICAYFAIRCADCASKPSSGQRSKSKESVKRPIRAHRCKYLPLVGGASPGLVFFDKSTPHGFLLALDGVARQGRTTNSFIWPQTA